MLEQQNIWWWNSGTIIMEQWNMLWWNSWRSDGGTVEHLVVELWTKMGNSGTSDCWTEEQSCWNSRTSDGGTVEQSWWNSGTSNGGTVEHLMVEQWTEIGEQWNMWWLNSGTIMVEYWHRDGGTVEHVMLKQWRRNSRRSDDGTVEQSWWKSRTYVGVRVNLV